MVSRVTGPQPDQAGEIEATFKLKYCVIICYTVSGIIAFQSSGHPWRLKFLTNLLPLCKRFVTDLLLRSFNHILKVFQYFLYGEKKHGKLGGGCISKLEKWRFSDGHKISGKHPGLIQNATFKIPKPLAWSLIWASRSSASMYLLCVHSSSKDNKLFIQLKPIYGSL